MTEESKSSNDQPIKRRPYRRPGKYSKKERQITESKNTGAEISAQSDLQISTSTSKESSQKRQFRPQTHRQTDLNLNPEKILIAEFEYARETAAQAMDDRHKMVNFYLIIVGVIFTAVASLLSTVKKSSLGESIADVPWTCVTSVLLAALFLVGFLYLMKLIRLRQAWRDSALSMNQIKDYYSKRLGRYRLNKFAFRWTTRTLPSANKLWTVFFFSALLIVLLDSLALMGSLLLAGIFAYIIIIAGLLSGVIQIGLYMYLLREDKSDWKN